MIEKNLKSMSPTKLRIVLLALILLMLAGTGTGFWLFRSQLVSYAEEVNKLAAEANVSESDVSNLQQLKVRLDKDTVAITRAKNVVADSKGYQDQVINDISLFARNSNVTIAGYSFEIDKNLTSGSNNTATSTPAPVTMGSTDTSMAAAPSSLKPATVTVTLKTPVDYESLLKFLHGIETNLTKMQLSGISISQSPQAKNMVTVNPLTIQVYTR